MQMAKTSISVDKFSISSVLVVYSEAAFQELILCVCLSVSLLSVCLSSCRRGDEQ